MPAIYIRCKNGYPTMVLYIRCKDDYPTTNLYIMIHITHKVQKELQDPAQKGKHTPSSPLKRVKVTWSSGLVKMSASWSWVGTWIKAIFPFSTLSLKK